MNLAGLTLGGRGGSLPFMKALVLGLLLAGLCGCQQRTVEVIPASMGPSEVGRYQIVPKGDVVYSGLGLMLDTATGRTWMLTANSNLAGVTWMPLPLLEK